MRASSGRGVRVRFGGTFVNDAVGDFTSASGFEADEVGKEPERG